MRPDLIKSKGENKIAQVTLQDCLACSGCVTSAEAVLIQQHSVEEFLNLFSADENVIFVAISP
jgi:iron only hydrogenase large subunit-like protein